MMRTDDSIEADLLNDEWDRETGDWDRRPVTAAVSFASDFRALAAFDDAPPPGASFVLRLRDRLTTSAASQAIVRSSNTSQRGIAIVSAPPMASPRSLALRLAIATAAAAVVFAVALSDGDWLTDNGGAPIVASAHASLEAASPTAGPTSTAWLVPDSRQTLDQTTLLRSDPGSTSSAEPVGMLPPSSHVDVSADWVDPVGVVWLLIESISGETGWLRADELVADGS